MKLVEALLAIHGGEEGMYLPKPVEFGETLGCGLLARVLLTFGRGHTSQKTHLIDADSWTTLFVDSDHSHAPWCWLFHF